MDDETYKSLKNGEYKLLIDSTHFMGSMTIGECVLEGETEEEVLISSYLCHPSMGNNELSGPIVLSYLYDKLKSRKINTLIDSQYSQRQLVLLPIFHIILRN